MILKIIFNFSDVSEKQKCLVSTSIHILFFFLLFFKNYEEFLESQELSAFADNFSTWSSSKVRVFSSKKVAFSAFYTNFALFHQTRHL